MMSIALLHDEIKLKVIDTCKLVVNFFKQFCLCISYFKDVLVVVRPL